jgi:uncharacterized protein (DUF1330 family)
MKTNYKVAIALVAGAAIGGAAIQGLHAQAKPPIYLVTEVDVTNPEAYGREFVPKVQALFKAMGARDLARGGGAPGTPQVTVYEGAPLKRVGIQVWDSLEKIEGFRNSAEFKEARRIGDKYATFRSYAIEGVPQ